MILKIFDEIFVRAAGRALPPAHTARTAQPAAEHCPAPFRTPCRRAPAAEFPSRRGRTKRRQPPSEKEAAARLRAAAETFL